MVDVDDGKPRVREPLRGRGDGVPLRKTDADDQVVSLARQRHHVRDVGGRRRRLDDPALHSELPLGTLETLVRKLIEPVVVELTLVGREADFQRLRRRRGRMPRHHAGNRRDHRQHACRENRPDLPVHRPRLSLVLAYES